MLWGREGHSVAIKSTLYCWWQLMVVCPVVRCNQYCHDELVRWLCVHNLWLMSPPPVFTIEYEIAGGTLTCLLSQYDYPSPFWGIRGKPAAHIWQKQRPTGSPSVQGRIHQGTQHQVCYISTLMFWEWTVLFPCVLDVWELSHLSPEISLGGFFLCSFFTCSTCFSQAQGDWHSKST